MENSVEIFVWFTTAFSFGLGFVWNRHNWPNILLKLLFYVVAAWGAWLAVTSAGYIIQIGGGG